VDTKHEGAVKQGNCSKNTFIPCQKNLAGAGRTRVTALKIEKGDQIQVERTFITGREDSFSIITTEKDLT